MRIAVAALVLVFASVRAHADTPAAPDDDSKSMLAAEAMSLGPTAAGMFLFLVSQQGSSGDDPSTQKSSFTAPAVLLTLGPSLGHLYTHSYGLAAIGAAVRLGGALLVYDGMGRCDPSQPPFITGECQTIGQSYSEQRAGLTIILVAAAAQLIDAPISVSRWNNAHPSVSVMPTAAPGRIGLAIAGTF